MKNTNKAGKYVGIGCAAVAGLLILGIIVSMFVGIFTLSKAPKKAVEDDKNSTVIDSASVMDFSETYTDVKDLYLDYDAGDLTIKSGDALKVEGTYLPGTFEAKNDNGTLSIATNMDKSHQDFFINGSKDGKYPNLTITLPQNLKLEDCTLNLGAGQAVLGNINTNSLSIDMGAGAVTGNTITAKEAHISNGAGAVNLSGMDLNNLDLSGGVGETIYEGKLTGESKISGGVGQTTLNLTGATSDYNITAESGVGSGVLINGKAYDEAAYKPSGAVNTLDVESGVGSLNVNFK